MSESGPEAGLKGTFDALSQDQRLDMVTVVRRLLAERGYLYVTAGMPANGHRGFPEADVAQDVIKISAFCKEGGDEVISIGRLCPPCGHFVIATCRGFYVGSLFRYADLVNALSEDVKLVASQRQAPLVTPREPCCA